MRHRHPQPPAVVCLWPRCCCRLCCRCHPLRPLPPSASALLPPLLLLLLHSCCCCPLCCLTPLPPLRPCRHCCCCHRCCSFQPPLMPTARASCCRPLCCCCPRCCPCYLTIAPACVTASSAAPDAADSSLQPCGNQLTLTPITSLSHHLLIRPSIRATASSAPGCPAAPPQTRNSQKLKAETSLPVN